MPQATRLFQELDAIFTEPLLILQLVQAVVVYTPQDGTEVVGVCTPHDGLEKLVTLQLSCPKSCVLSDNVFHPV